MDPVSVAAISALIFGAVVAFSAFIRQLFISRDKELNEKAHRRALEREIKGLDDQRIQMLNKKRFTFHYHVLGDLKDGIKYIDNQIEEVFRKKLELIQRYAKMTENESSSIIFNRSDFSRKAKIELLRKEIDSQIEFYDQELQELQRRRGSICVAHLETQQKLVEHEQSRNESLDKLYHRHTGLLEKVYLRHSEGIDTTAKESLDSGWQTYKDLFMMPVEFLKQFFSSSDGVNLQQMQDEIASRGEVLKMESELNAPKNAPHASVHSRPILQ